LTQPLDVEAADVIVIGGGFAGLSAGVELAERGLRVTLLEGRQLLGGRAYSFADSASRDFVDNGQHVLMGCYHQTLDFLDKIGTRDRLILHGNLDIEMLEGPGLSAHLRAAPLPGPFHLFAGLMRYKHLSRPERLGAVYAGMRIMFMRRFEHGRLARMTVADVMDLTRQGLQARRSFWYPLAIATLNEDPQLASAGLLAEVLKRAFFSRRGDSAFLYSTVGLSDLYCTAAREFIEQHRGAVACQALVEGVEIHNGAARGVRLRDGRRMRADNIVAAVPPAQLLRLLPQQLFASEFLAQVATLKSSPIICVHAWFDREITRSPFIGFIGTTTQWLFNKARIFTERAARYPGYLSFVISGARKLAELSNDELLEIVTTDLRKMIPTAGRARLTRALVLKEKHATIAPDPASDAARPGVETPIANFFVAGDWIRTGLPATIESAVISGRSDRKSTRLNSSHPSRSRMPSSA